MFNSLFVGYGFHVLAVAAGRSLQYPMNTSSRRLLKASRSARQELVLPETYRLLRTPRCRSLELVKGEGRQITHRRRTGSPPALEHRPF